MIKGGGWGFVKKRYEKAKAGGALYSVRIK